MINVKSFIDLLENDSIKPLLLKSEKDMRIEAMMWWRTLDNSQRTSLCASRGILPKSISGSIIERLYIEAFR
jgi:hypothetical protein